MTYAQAMKQLRSNGSAQTRKTYARHGMREPMFGVSFANLYKQAAQIGFDQKLAEKLWNSGNCDARLLATMVADPQTIRAATLDQWARDVDCYGLADVFSKLVVQSPLAERKMKAWMDDKREFVSQAGWTLAARMAMNGQVPDAFFDKLLRRIERDIHGALNYTRYAMNNTLIAIGGSRMKLTKKAIAAAGRIGVVEVDHGQTDCKTPDAIPYIQKMIARKRKAK